MQKTKWCTVEHIAQYGHKQSVGSKIYLNGTKTRFFIWPGRRTHKLESVDIFPGNFLFSPLSVVAQNFLWLRWLFLVSSMAVELVIARVQTLVALNMLFTVKIILGLLVSVKFMFLTN